MISGHKNKYRPTIGLEIHTELNTKTKMFCRCKNDPDEKRPNVNICPVCLGHPGTLPVINEEAVRKVIRTGIATNCRISEHPRFDRKNYFYPDLPKNYQISQLYQPLCKNGFLDIEGKKVRIREIHLEEDVGKLIHRGEYSLVDFNRAGVPLMELVTEPDITSGKEARRFAEELKLIIRYLDVSQADMEKGEMRVEVNISLSDKKVLGTKVEIKNLNSFRAVEGAVDYEIKRQRKILESGKDVIQETRGWDSARGVTFSQREKEEANDYRYFPEPDLPPLHITKDFVKRLEADIPELPYQKRKRFQKEYGLGEKSIEIFARNKEFADYFEETMSELREWVKEVDMKREVKKEEFFRLAKLCANYLISDLKSLLKEGSMSDVLITPENFAEFITLIYDGKISSKMAKMILEEMFLSGEDPSHIIREKKLKQITDAEEIERIIREVISENPKPVKDFREGRENALQFLIGQVMSKTEGKASPAIVGKILKQLLREDKP